MPLRFKIHVDAPPEDAFAYLADFTRHGEWANTNSGLKVEAASEGPVGVGSKFRSTQRFVGKDTRGDITVTEYDPPSRLGFTSVQPGKRKDVTYTNVLTLSTDGNGTLIERTLDTTGPKVMFYMAYPAIRPDAMKALRRLKAQLESAPR